MTVITHYKLLPAQYEFLFGLDKGKINDKDTLLDVALYQGGFTCVPSDTEYLSPTGWRRIDTLTKDDKLAVYYDNGEIKYEHPLEVFKWKADKWYEFHTRTLWQKVCPNHKMVTWSSNNKKRTQSMVEYYDEHERLKQGHSGKFKTTFNINGTKTGFSERELRLLVAYQADGTEYKQNPLYNCRFCLCKKRKISRLINLLDGYNTKIVEQSDGDICVYANIPDKLKIKLFPRQWYELSSSELSIIVDEIPYWDGSIGKHNCYYTSIKENADFIQFAGSATGYRSTIFTRTRPSASGSGKLVTEYRVNFNTNTMPSLQATRNKVRITVTKAKEGDAKYCPSTSTGMWLARYKNYIFVTGNSGKTFSGSLRGILFALTWAGCKGLVGALGQDMLDNTTKAKYIEHLTNMGFKEDVHYWFADKRQTLILKNGSQIRFKTLSDWRQFRSTEFTWVEIEEASLIDLKTFQELIARVREQKRENWKDYYRSVFLHTNPQGMRGWIYKLFFNPKTKVDGYRSVIASTRENYHNGEGYYQNLLNLYGADDVMELLEGRDVDKDNTVAFPTFNELNVKSDIEFDNNYPLILTCDFNYNPMCWYLQQKKGDYWYVIRELIEKNVTTQQMCEIILPVLNEYKTKKIHIMGDAHGRDKKTNGSDYSVMLSYFSQKGFDCTLLVSKSNPPIKERLAVLRKLICNGKMERSLFVSANCKKLIYNFEENKNNLSNGGLRMPTDTEIQNDYDKIFLIHPIDAISYPMYYYHTLDSLDKG